MLERWKSKIELRLLIFMAIVLVSLFLKNALDDNESLRALFNTSFRSKIGLSLRKIVFLITISIGGAIVFLIPIKKNKELQKNDIPPERETIKQIEKKVEIVKTYPKENIPNEQEESSENKKATPNEIVLTVIFFGLIMFLAYINFTEKIVIMKSVKQFYPSFFVGCDWVAENTIEDSLIATLWVHRASYCTQRRVAILNADVTQTKNLSYMLEVLDHFGINYLWINKFSIDPENKHYAERIDLSWVQLLEANPDSFKKIYETGPPMRNCVQQMCDGNIVYEIKG